MTAADWTHDQFQAIRGAVSHAQQTVGPRLGAPGMVQASWIEATRIKKLPDCIPQEIPWAKLHWSLDGNLLTRSITMHFTFDGTLCPMVKVDYTTIDPRHLDTGIDQTVVNSYSVVRAIIGSLTNQFPAESLARYMDERIYPMLGGEINTPIYQQIAQERIQQRAQWSLKHDDEHTPVEWQDLIRQRSSEAMDSLLEARDTDGYADKYRYRVVQEATVLVAHLEALDRLAAQGRVFCPACVRNPSEHGRERNGLRPRPRIDDDCSVCGGIRSISREYAERMATGRKLRKARLAKDMRLGDFMHLGYSPEQVNQFETGATLVDQGYVDAVLGDAQAAPDGQ